MNINQLQSCVRSGTFQLGCIGLSLSTSHSALSPPSRSPLHIFSSPLLSPQPQPSFFHIRSFIFAQLLLPSSFGTHYLGGILSFYGIDYIVQDLGQISFFEGWRVRPDLTEPRLPSDLWQSSLPQLPKCYLLPPYKSLGSNPSHQTWQQASLAAKPSFQPLFVL